MQVGSYYIWKDPDGTLREKYMECVPVIGTQYRIAATTYMDEFDAPIRNTQKKAQAAIASMNLQMILMTVLVTGAALLAAFVLSAYISYPVAALITASKFVEAGEFASVDLSKIEKRKDELGGLARVFSKMLQQVEHREQTLKKEVQELQGQVKVLIEIDEARRQKQVSEITSSKYFEELQRKAREMRQAKSSNR
jgi:nitrogen fixation/metabolism regulation signal transduction histidine kinase